MAHLVRLPTTHHIGIAEQQVILIHLVHWILQKPHGLIPSIFINKVWSTIPHGH